MSSHLNSPLAHQVRTLLDHALDAFAGTAASAELEAQHRRLEEPMRVAIAGRVKAGKSTLLNALIGEQLAPTDAGECTKVVTWYQHGPTYRVTLALADGRQLQARFSREHGVLDIDLGAHQVHEIDHIVVEWPTAALRDLTLIDTPGVGSANREVSERTVAFLSADQERPTEADAVLYLMRHMHSSDLSFLESFHDDDLAHATPVNAIGVLSRADEIGAGRPDALRSARRIALRYRTDPKLRRLCQTVHPVAGLLAETGESLMEDEFQALRRLAELPREAADALLLSADRFLAENATDVVTALERRHLVDRLGMFGVRIALPLVRQGRASTARELADALVKRSGIDDLRSDLLDQFSRRRDVLRARSALQAIAAVVSTHGDPTGTLTTEIERIRASAHVLAEMRLLNALRREAIAFPAADVDRVDRLLSGAGAAERLGLATDASSDEIATALVAEVAHWRRRGGSPLATRSLTEAAEILIRTCEGMLATVPQPADA